MTTILDVMDMTRRKDTGGLINALQYRGDTAVRAEAAMALGRFDDTQATPPLISTLQNDGDPMYAIWRQRRWASLGTNAPNQPY